MHRVAPMPMHPGAMAVSALLAAQLLAPLAQAATPANAVSQSTASTPTPRRADAWVVDLKHLPAPVRLHYRVSSNQFPYRLSGELVWQHDQQRYRARLSFGAFGLTRTQTSQGLIGSDGLAPERFSDQARTQTSERFDRAQGKVSFNAPTPDLPLLPGAQDRLSVLVQLGALLASDPARFPVGTAVAFQTIAASGGEMWRFTIETTDTLTLPNGPQAALKLVRQPREAGDQRVEIWLAPVLGYLPARIRITEANGDAIDQVWQSSEAVGPLD